MSAHHLADDPRVGSRRERVGRILMADAPGRLPLPFPPLVLGMLTLAAYCAVSFWTSSDHARFDLVSVPVFVSAALLPAGGALLVGGGGVLFALAPVAADPSTVAFEGLHVVEVLVIVAAALVLRAALARRVLGEVDQAERDARSADRMRTVLGIAERLTRSLDRDAIFGTIVSEVTHAMGTDATTIRLLRGDDLVLSAWAGITDEVAARLPVLRRDEGWFAEMVRTGRPLISDDGHPAEDDEGYELYHGLLEYASDLVVPLVRHDEVIGTLATVTLRPRAWTIDDVDFLTAVATHASIAISNAELFEQTEGRAAQLAVLQAASARMNRQNTVESVGRAIVEETRLILDYHNARVYLLEPPDDLVPIAFAGSVGEYEKVDFDLLRTTLGVGFTGWVAQHGEPLIIDEANADPRGSTIPGTDDVDESMLVVPIRYDEGVIGVITLSKLGLRQFHEDDLRLLAILADQAATALESARLLRRSQQLAAELRRLVDMSGELAHSLDPRQVADSIARHLVQAMGVEICLISYWDRPGDRIQTLGSYPPPTSEGPGPSYDLGGFPETRRVLEEQATSVVDVDDPAADRAEVALMRAEGNASLAMLPLVANGATIGLVELQSSRHVGYDPAHLDLARTMANEAAMALENARLYEATRALADHDQLTGFYNHRYLHERLGEEVIRAQRSRRPLSVLMIDLDDFKLVNDTFGHLFGDRVLAWVGELIRSTLRGSDVPARYGGDEFAVILPDTDGEAAGRAAERILEACRMRAFRGEARGPLPIGLSIGLATFPTDARGAQELVAAADRALYRVKSGGGRGAVRAAAELTVARRADADAPGATTPGAADLRHAG